MIRLEASAMRVGFVLLLIGATGVALPAGADGQSRGLSVLTLLPVEDRRIVVGSWHDGALDSLDFRMPTGQYVQAWRLEGRSGQAVRIDLESTDFDAYLRLVGPGLGEGLQDDDGGSGLDSRLCVELPATGEYMVVAAGLGGAVGRYRLRLSDWDGTSECHAGEGDAFEGEEGGEGSMDPAALEALFSPPAHRVVPPDGRVEGRLGPDDDISGVLLQGWYLRGEPGGSVTVDMLSDSLDAVLLWSPPGSMDPEDMVADDDGAGGCNARLTLTMPESGETLLLAGSLSAGGGPFALRAFAATEPPPPSSEPCVGGGASETEEGDLIVDVGDLAVAGALRPGVPVAGHLRMDAPTAGGDPSVRWQITGAADDTVRIELTSDAFDPYLRMIGPGLEASTYDDDGGEGTNSRLCVQLPADGTYDVVVTSWQGRGSGPYELAAYADATGCAVVEVVLDRALATLPTDGRVLPLETAVAGGLEEASPRIEGKHMQAWRLDAPPGEEVTVDLRSEEFDAYLYVLGPGLEPYSTDDDSGGGCNPRMTFTASSEGTYTVIATTFRTDATGAYTLRATRAPEPAGTEPCDWTGGESVGGETGTGGSGTASGVDPAVVEGLPVDDGRVLPLGVEVEGVFGASEIDVEGIGRAQPWLMEGRRGDSVIVELLSEDFDPVLYLHGPGMDEVLRDDDSAGSLDSRIQARLPADGTVRLLVAAYGAEAGGSFRLRALRTQTGEEVEARYRRAIERAPAEPGPYLDLAGYLEDRGETGRAEEVLEEARRRVADRARLEELLGDWLRRQGRDEEALEAYLAAVETDPARSPDFSQLGWNLYNAGAVAPASRAWREAVRVNPDDFSTRNNLAWAYYRLGRLEEAALYSDSSLALSRRTAGGSPAAYQLDTRANIHLDAGEPDQALELFERAIGMSESPEANLLLGRAMSLHALGRQAEALEALEEAVAAEEGILDGSYLDEIGYSPRGRERIGSLLELRREER